MILKELTIRGFGRFHDRTLVFGDGINVIYGGNEAGKSTIHSFLRAMFFGMERSRGRAAKTDFFSHYEPWFGDGAYGGILKLEHDGHTYRLERNFRKDPMDLTVVDETDGRELSDPKGFLSSLLGGLSQTAYMNTISIGQLKSATDGGMVSELKNYIANMNTAGNVALNITKASAFLRDQRRSFEKQIQVDAAKDYAADVSEIRKIETLVSSPDYENRIPELTKEQEAAAAARKALKEERDGLLQKNAADRQLLRSSRFEGRADIEAFETQALEKLSAYEAAEAKAAGNGLRTFAFILLFAAAGMGAAGWFDRSSAVMGASGMPLRSFLFGAAGACVLLALILLGLCSGRNRAKQAAASAFLEVIRSRTPELLPPAGESPDCRAAAAELAERTGTLKELCGSIEAGDRALEELDRKLAAEDAKQAESAAGLLAQQKSQWQLEQQLLHLTNLRDEAAALKNVVAENDRLRFEIDAIDIAQETMSRLSTTIRDSFGLYLNRNASDLVSGITGGIYNSLSIDQDLGISLNTSEKLVPLDQVSSGTMDQVYLALRLAAADLMQEGSDPLPLLFDDSFVNYDESRLRTVLAFLSKQYAGRQILIFSCHRREAQILRATMQEYTLTEL